MGGDRLGAQRRDQGRVHVEGAQRRGREVQRDQAVRGDAGAEDTTADGTEPDPLAGQPRLAQGMGGGEGGVAAERDLGPRGEPAQRPVGVAARGQAVQEGGLGEVDLGGELLHPLVGGERVPVEDQDAGRVPGERAVGEGVDDSNPHESDAMRAGRPPRRPIRKRWRCEVWAFTTYGERGLISKDQLSSWRRPKIERPGTLPGSRGGPASSQDRKPVTVVSAMAISSWVSPVAQRSTTQ